MSRRCRNAIYGIMGSIGVMMAALLIKLLFFSGSFAPLLALNDVKTMGMEMSTSFQGPGARARFRFSDYGDEVRVEGDLNTKKPGAYTLTYISDKCQKAVGRRASVIDTTPSKINLKGGSSIRTFENGSFQELGYQASDNHDGNVSESMEWKGSVNIKKRGTYALTYMVRDVSSSTTSTKHSARVCANPTNTKLYYNHGSYDNTMEERQFNKSKNHRRTTGAKDEKLLKKCDSYYQEPKEKVIYLTLDEDGNDITYVKQITGILKKNDMQATYFLTRSYIKTEVDLIRQSVRDGSVIRNHGWHHYGVIILVSTSSIDKFATETTGTERACMEATGWPTKKVLRFPKGGSSKRAMKLIRDLGYDNYFWNHAYYDYTSGVSGSEILKTMMEHYHKGAIYLLHLSNKGNYEAMDTFTRNMKDLGYDFEIVDTIPSDVWEK